MKAPTAYASLYILLTDEGEPECYNEAIADEHKVKWLSTMQDEMKSLDDEEFTLVKIHTNDNGSDMLTKNLPMDRTLSLSTMDMTS